MPSRRDRSSPLPGFPWEEPFQTSEEVREYLSGDKIQCLICGRWLRSVGHHLPKAHGMSVEEYQDRYRIPRSKGLVGTATKAAFSASVRRTIESGALDEQHRQLAAMAKDANDLSVVAYAELKRQGGRGVADRFMITPGILQEVFALVVTGDTAATAIKKCGLSWTGFHETMKRYPELAPDYQQAKRVGHALRRKARRDLDTGRFT